MSIFSQIREVVKLMKKKQDLGANILELEQRLGILRLEATRQIDAMSKTDGWKCIADEIVRELRQGIKKIYDIADQEGVDKQRSYLKGRCDALNFIIATVDKWKNKEELIRREVDELLKRSNHN